MATTPSSNPFAGGRATPLASPGRSDRPAGHTGGMAPHESGMYQPGGPQPSLGDGGLMRRGYRPEPPPVDGHNDDGEQTERRARS